MKANKALKQLMNIGYVKIHGNIYVAAGKIFELFKRYDESNDSLDKLSIKDKLTHCKILLTQEGQYYTIRRKFIEIGLNPTDKKFINIQYFLNNYDKL